MNNEIQLQKERAIITERIMRLFAEIDPGEMKNIVNIIKKMNSENYLHLHRKLKANISGTEYSLIIYSHNYDKLYTIEIVDISKRSLYVFNNEIMLNELIEIIWFAYIFSGNVEDFAPSWEYILIQSIKTLENLYPDGMKCYLEQIIDGIDNKENMDISAEFGHFYMTVHGNYKNLTITISAMRKTDGDDICVANIYKDYFKKEFHHPMYLIFLAYLIREL